MNEDITYCFVDCPHLKCERNKKHIKLLIPHSFADLTGTGVCVAKKYKNKKPKKSAAAELIRAQGEQMQRESADMWLKRRGVKMEKRGIG